MWCIHVESFDKNLSVVNWIYISVDLAFDTSFIEIERMDIEIEIAPKATKYWTTIFTGAVAGIPL